MIRAEAIEQKPNGIAARSLAAAGISNRIPLDRIAVDGGTQSRAALSQDTIQEYAASIKEGAEFPGVVVFYDGSSYWMADGFHRYHAHLAAGLADIAADVRQGTRRDAILYSVGANSSHGLRRTNDDKRRAVLTLLNDTEWAGWSDREISRKCAVGAPLVGRLRAEAVTVTNYSERTYTTKHGTTAVMNTAAIGKSNSPEENMEQNQSVATDYSAPLPRGRLSTPEGRSLEQIGREGLALEADGVAPDEAAKRFRLGVQTYRRICDIVYLFDRGGLNQEDKAAVARAVVLLNETLSANEAWELVSPIAVKVWGDGSDKRPRADREPARFGRFEHALAIVLQSCLTTAEIDLPYLPTERARIAIKQIAEARSALLKFSDRIKEIHQ